MERGTQLETQVVVVGAGPVGMSTAMDLAWRGIDVVVCERRRPDQPPGVKCNHVAARTMEIFRRLGVARAVRDAGLPPGHPHDVAFRTSTVGIELARIPIPARRDRYVADEGPDTGWPTPEPPHRVNQIFLEPILLEHLSTMAGVRILHDTEVLGFEQDDRGVVVTARSGDEEEKLTLAADYLVACDGGASPTRKAIGAKFEGDPVVQKVQSTYIRAPRLTAEMRDPPAWGIQSLNPRRSGMLYAIDGVETWIVHNYLREGEDFEDVARDRAIRDILGVDDRFEVEHLKREDWIGRRLVADRFRDRRVFICGDAAHIWVPFAGYGMNAGIADAMNLTWLLAAHLGGWADEAILDAHEAERLPITEQVSRYAMGHAHKLSKQRASVPTNIEDPTPEGEFVRKRIGEEAYNHNVSQYAAIGLNFGYFYDRSPIIAYDDAEPPAYDMATYEPSTVPGCRLPHLWLPDGASLYDVLGPDYSLLVFDRDVDVEPLVRAAHARSVPLEVVDLTDVGRHGPYAAGLVLGRPDQHVGWRGDAIPEDPDGLLDVLVGRGVSGVSESDGLP